MSNYDKTVSMTREEEGTYHRREIECEPPSNPKNYTQHYSQIVSVPSYKDKQPAAHRSGGYLSGSDDDNFEEWTTSKRKVNHTTRQVETRVSRQLLVEDGKVIADSGPQVTTRIKEDNKVEECEKEKAPKNKGKFEAIENSPEGEHGSGGRVLGEKKEIQRVSREVREENMQYHDERFKELTGQDVHRRAIQAPHELITITDKNSHASSPRGKMVHYSNKGKKYQDTDEILEIAKMAIDGSITKEVKRTKHHEEFSEDEKPDEKGEAEALKHEPIVTRSSRKHVDYVNDFDDTSTPSISSDDEIETSGNRPSPYQQRRTNKKSSTMSSPKQHGRTHKVHKHREEDEAFPRYEPNALLDSLQDTGADHHYRQSRYGTTSSRSPVRYIDTRRKDRPDSSDNEMEHSRRQYHQQRQRSQSPAFSQSGGPVEIPEEYRVNKQRLLHGKSGGRKSSPASIGRQHQHQRERSFSPVAGNRSQMSVQKSSSKGLKSSRRKEDASIQAHLTDEEQVERKSLSSSSSSSMVNSHEKTTRHLQRQSTANSSRNYYFGERRHQKSNRAKSPAQISISSSSSSDSLSDPKERMRKNGARSKDSGFRSPHHVKQQYRTTTPTSTGSQQQIYSVSSKRRGGGGGEATSPTPTNASQGQRSVKTTTTTMSAGLADRPLSRNERSTSTATTTTEAKTFKRTPSQVSNSKGDKLSRRSHYISSSLRSPSSNGRHHQILPNVVGGTTREKQQTVVSSTNNNGQQRKSMKFHRHHHQHQHQQHHKATATSPQNDDDSDDNLSRRSFDNVSMSSLGPNATTIKVPYKRMYSEHEVVPQQQEMFKANSVASMRPQQQNGCGSTASSVVESSPPTSRMKDDIVSLRKRLDNIKTLTVTRSTQRNSGQQTDEDNNNKEVPQQHFDYKTIVANVQAAPIVPRQHVVDAYNVRVIEHNSPFYNQKQPNKTVSELSNSIARLELLSSSGASTASSSGINNNNTITRRNGNATATTMENNNEANFNLSDYSKHKAIPVVITSSGEAERVHSDDDDDRISLISSCSLRSSRTYDIRLVPDKTQTRVDHLLQLEVVKGNSLDVNGGNTTREQHDKQESQQAQGGSEKVRQIDFDNDDGKKLSAWVFDLRDGSSTAIVAPPKPKPESPKIDAKTEELAESRGGRSYYLELIETADRKAARRQRPCSIDALYSRWNSHSNLTTSANNNNNNFKSPPHQRQSTPTKSPIPFDHHQVRASRVRQMVPAATILDTATDSSNHLTPTTSTKGLTSLAGKQQHQQAPSLSTVSNNLNNKISQQRRQLPFSGPPLSNRSKSSSCLIGSTRSSKYSIYGGLRRPDSDNKPVPRLSYSRAIGPKSQRQLDAQPKTPSRYLKMK